MVKRRDIINPPQQGWKVNGAIRLGHVPSHYYVDFSMQEVTQRCFNAVEESQFVLLSGPRASGKSTRLDMLAHKLRAQGYEVIEVDFQHINPEDSLESFWDTFSFSLSHKISSAHDFLEYLHCRNGEPTSVVLIIDEVSPLYKVQPNVRDSFLDVCRAIRNTDGIHAIRSVIAAGSNIADLSTNPSSPFNSGIHIQNSNFTREEVGQLFHEFANDQRIQIGDDIVEDLFSKTNGHPGLVCLCGRTMEENLKSLVIDRIMSKKAWHLYCAENLYESVWRYNAFDSMLKFLKNRKANPVDPVISLLRRRFLGNLKNLRVDSSDKESADFLTAEGVLVKDHSDQLYYRVSSPLVDGLLRTQLLRVSYPPTPLGPPLLRGDNSLDIVATLKKAVGWFDRQHMANAYRRSFKLSGGITVDKMKQRQVPRENVYDTELMRILGIWFAPFEWEVQVTCQWHMGNKSNKHNFSDITLTHKGVAGRTTCILGLLATGVGENIKSHINKMPEYAKLRSATEAWTIHFTCEDGFAPVEHSLDMLSKGVNVLHFVHDLDWTKVVVHRYWKDRNGCTQEVKGEVVVDNAATAAG